MPHRLIDWLTNLFRPDESSSPARTALLDAAPGSRPATAATAAAAASERAVQIVGHVSELTTAVATQVEEHTGSIGALNDQLRDVQQGDAAAVADVIRKLLETNENLQRRLEQAEVQLQSQHRQLQNVVIVSRTDSLTGLMNRRVLDEELTRCLTNFSRKGRPSVLVMLDVDHFKLVNDTHGHAAGDLVLKHVADVLLANFRESDLVARFGGEEFAVILHGATTDAALVRAEKARSAIGQAEIEVEGKRLRVSASAGITQTAENDSAVTLLSRADGALYAAKRHGRNCGFWTHRDHNLLVELLPSEATAPVAAASELQLGEDQQAELELARDQFGDSTFVANVARRIAEWRRGGATFSVIVARLDNKPQLLAAGNERAVNEAARLIVKNTPTYVRDMDLVTRWMSEGLAVLLPGAATGDAVRVARRLLRGVQGLKLNTGGEEIPLSLGIGLAEGIEGNDAHRVLCRAWQALNAATAQGAGGILVHDGVKIRPCGTAAASR